MGPESSTPRAKPPRAGSKAGLGWYLLGAVLVGLGLVTLVWPRLFSGPRITGEVLPELEPADRIEVSSGALRDWNVLLVTLDTTRADHLGCYGNQAIETPRLDDLAREGVLFAQATTPVPATLPAHSSLLTGLYPYRHGARANGTFRLTEDQLTLAEILRGHGYRTGAAISAFVLDGRYGLDQGFDTYADDLTRGIQYSPQMFRERAAELTNEPVRAWLREHAGERFFFWAHYFDAHAVYLPPEPYRSRYAHDLYAGEIAYLDSQLGVILDELDALGLRDHTLVVVTADHGEGLGEHGEQTHSLLVYDSTLHVPLLFHAPGRIPSGVVVARQASLVDVLPTVLDLLGVPAPADLDGRSLLADPPPGPRAVYIETLSTMTLHGWAPLLGVRRDDYKFILAPQPEIYDLRLDPGETQNRFDARTDLAAELQQELVGFVGDDPWLAARARQNVSLDAEAQEHLRALGYVASTGEAPPTSAVDELPDPKVMVYHWEDVQQAVNLRNAGEIEDAIAALEKSLEAVPRDVWSMQILGSAYATHGDYDQALEIYQRALALAPSDPGLHLAVGSVHLALGQLAEARQAVDRAAELDPESGAVRIARANLAYRTGDEARALGLLEEAIELDPGSSGPSAYNEMATIHFVARRLDAAREAWNRALEIDALNGPAHDGLAQILIEEGKLDEAKRELALALRFAPAQPRALATLGGILSDEGDHEAARRVLERALAMSPKLAPALNNLALLHRRRGELDRAQATYQEAIDVDPYYDLPHANLAQLYLARGQEEEAMEEFRRTLRVNPRNRIALANLGTYYLRAGRHDEAHALLLLAVRVDPDYAMAHKYLGLVYQAQGDPARSLHHLRKSVELDPYEPEVEKVRYLIAKLEAEAAAAGETQGTAPAVDPPAPRPGEGSRPGGG